MKLIVRDDIREGQMRRKDAFIVVGKMLDHKGCYVLFNLPFIRKKVEDYIDMRTWEPRPALCYYRADFTIRYRPKDNRWLFYGRSVWDEVINKGK